MNSRNVFDIKGWGKGTQTPSPCPTPTIPAEAKLWKFNRELTFEWYIKRERFRSNPRDYQSLDPQRRH